MAPLHAEPKASSEQVSQSLAGHLAVVLERREGWRRVRLRDGYEGWMHEGYLDARALGANAAREWLATARHSLGCTIHDARADMERTLPLGARVPKDAKIVAGGVLDEAESSPPLSAGWHRGLRVGRAIFLEHVVSVGRDYPVGRGLLGDGAGGVRPARRGVPA